MLSALLIILLFQPIDLELISLRQARYLEGKPAIATFIVGKPPYTFKSSTIVGTEDTPDWIERTVVLNGKRLDVKEGRRLTVTGTLRVIDHTARRIGKEVVPPWTEIRVEEEK